MNRDDIIRMAQEAGFAYFTPVEYINRFKKFSELVSAAEREACAKLCEELTGTVSMFASSRDARTHNAAVTECVAAIRART